MRVGATTLSVVIPRSNATRNLLWLFQDAGEKQIPRCVWNDNLWLEWRHWIAMTTV